MITIPAKDTKRFVQPNTGDTQGNLWATFGVDLTQNAGRVRTKRSKMAQNITGLNNGECNQPATAFTQYDIDNTGTPKFLTYAGRVIITTDPVSNTNSVTDYTNDPKVNNNNLGNGDMKVFNGKLYCTTGTEVKWKGTTGAWTTLSSGLTDTYAHPMDVYGDRLYIVDKNKVYSNSTSDVFVTSGSNTLDLSFFNGNISWIKAGSNRIWIGMTKTDGTKGLIFEWDGQSQNIWSKNYLIDAQGSTACAIYNDIPYVMDIEGRLLAYNGSGFVEVARLPLLQNDAISLSYTTKSGFKLTHFNGMVFSNDRLLINVDSSVSRYTLGEQSDTIENFPSGVWEYTKDTGLTHLMSASNTTYASSSAIDYGAAYTSTIAGAIYDASLINSYPAEYKTNIIFSSRILGTTSNTIWATFVDDIKNMKVSSSLTSAWLTSNQVSDVWKKIVTKYGQLKDAADKIKVKYRTVKADSISTNGTYSSNTQIVISSSSYYRIAEVAVGDECTILSGYGAGQVVHVSDISVNGSNYTITFDESIIGVTSTMTATVRFQNWRKIQPVITYAQKQFSDLTLPDKNKDIQLQFKVVTEWVGNNELYEMTVVNDAEQYSK